MFLSFLRRTFKSSFSEDGNTQLMVDLLTYADGSISVLGVAELLDNPRWNLYPLIETLKGHNLLELREEPDFP